MVGWWCYHPKRAKVLLTVSAAISAQSGVCPSRGAQRPPESGLLILDGSFHTILYHTILYFFIFYSTILYYTILYYTILYYTILYYTIHKSGGPKTYPNLL